MAVKNIIFDLGGVLLNIDYNRTEKAFAELGFSNWHDVYSQAAQIYLFDNFEKGRISESDFFVELKKLSGLQNISYDDLKDAWNAMLINFPQEHYRLLKNLQGHYRIFLLSNTNETHIQRFEKLIEEVCPVSEFENLFERIYYSCRMGLKKPDAACFGKVLSDNNLSAEETIFIDDSRQHITGAQNAGIRAKWLELPKTTEDLLGELGLI
jgi:putative hydrolase of the HAD superfamily